MTIRLEPTFSATNENLSSITEGLEISPEDNILSIAGSGDQAFAMLAEGGKVEVVDTDASQIRLVTKRAKHLADSDIEKFLAGEEIDPTSQRTELQIRMEYFLVKERIPRIRNNLGNLSIIRTPKNILELKNYGEFNKVYLSNILCYNKRTGRDLGPIENIAESLREPGLIYITNGRSFRQRAGNLENAQIDYDLTQRANMPMKDDSEHRPWTGWEPLVLRKRTKL